MKRIAALLVFVFAAHAQAALFDDTVARQQIFDLRNEVQGNLQKQDERLQQLEASNSRILDLLNQIEGLKQEIAGLRGKIEVLQFNQDEATKRQKDLYMDLDTRLRNIEQAREQARLAQQNAQAAAEQKQLDDAVALIKASKHKEGLAALEKFAKDNPQSTKLSEATYWMGVGYSALKDYKAANAAFNNVVNNAADSPRAPDALLGLATVAAAQKDNQNSRKHLVTIIEKYPQSEAAVTARKALTIQ